MYETAVLLYVTIPMCDTRRPYFAILDKTKAQLSAPAPKQTKVIVTILRHRYMRY